jgi:hypothetical protein
MNLGLHLLRNQNGTYSFVGSVPSELAYLDENRNPANKELVQNQMYLPAKYRKIKCRIFENQNDAIEAASQLGLKITSISLGAPNEQ